MTSPADPQVPSAERREEVSKLWREHGGTLRLYVDAHGIPAEGPGIAATANLWAFLATLDAQHAERTRAEVEKTREAAILQIQAEAADTEDGETLEALNRVIERLRSLSIKGTGQ